MATSTLGSGTLVLAGTTSGTTTVTATAVAGTTTLTLPAATDTLVGKATTDTLTNKTLTTPSVSSPTISDGTANGVPYLNGSKVLTTGSALVFDGTNFSNGAVWTTNPLRTSQPQYFQFGASTAGLAVAANGSAFIQLMRFSDNGSATNLIFSKGRGTYATPTAVASGDAMGTMDFRVYGGTNARTLASINGFVDTYTSDSNISSYLTFGVSPSGGAATSEVMRLTSTGLKTKTTISVGDATPSTSGAGITFPATQSASSDANTLDDYEEGTWTPTQGAGLTVVGAFSSSGSYTKIGRLVSIYGTVFGATSVATTAGTVMFGSLPFSAAEISPVGAMNNDNRNVFGGISVFGTTGYSATTIAAGTRIDFSITYSV